MKLDFVVAAIGLVFLGVGLWGVSIAVGAANDLAALDRQCAQNACTHAGTLVDRQHSFVLGGRLFWVGWGVDNCLLTIDLDSGRRQALIAGPPCAQLTVPAPISAEIWRGQIVSVHTLAGDKITYLHPSIALFAGLLRGIAFVPFGLCVAMIQYDVMSHRFTWRVRRYRPELSPPA